MPVHATSVKTEEFARLSRVVPAQTTTASALDALSDSSVKTVGSILIAFPRDMNTLLAHRRCQIILTYCVNC